MTKISEYIEKNFDNIILDIKKVTLIPSPTNKEQKRIAYLKKYIEDLGYKNTEIDKVGNLKITIKGKNPKLIVFSAHTDTVFKEDTELKIKEDNKIIACPGINDNSTGIVALIYLMKYIKENNILPSNDTTFLFNVCEECGGNLKGIRHFFDTTHRAKIKAHICSEGINLGRLTRKYIGSLRINIRIIGKGGHSWRNHNNPNTIVIASGIIQQIIRIALPKDPKTTLNIGTIKGGNSPSSIPQQTDFTVDIRSLDKSIINRIEKNIETIIHTTKKNDCTIEKSIIDIRPSGEMNKEWLIKLIQDIQTTQSIKTIDDPTSTDSNYPASLGLPSATIGITKAYNSHSKDEYMEKAPIKKGLEQLIMIFEGLEKA